MKAKILSLAVSAALMLSSCNVMNGNVVKPSEKRIQKEYTGQFETFDKIETSTAINVVYTQSNEPQKVVLDVPENMVEFVSLKVNNGKLDVSFKGMHSINGNHKTTVYVSGPAINKFETSSAGSIHLKNGVKYDGEVAIESSSAGNVYVEGMVKAKILYIESSSAGDIKVDGAEVDLLGVDCSSAGNVKVKNIKANTVSAEASSAGDITLEGNCRVLNKEKSSAGDINTKNLNVQN